MGALKLSWWAHSYDRDKTWADWVWNSSQIGGLWKPCNWLLIVWVSTPSYQTRQFSSLIIFSTSSSITFSRPNSFTQPTGAEVCSAPKTTVFGLLNSSEKNLNSSILSNCDSVTTYCIEQLPPRRRNDSWSMSQRNQTRLSHAKALVVRPLWQSFALGTVRY